MRYLRNTSTDPHYNMAFDEFCLESLPLEEPVFYLWQNRPSVIIGLNQNAYGEVNLAYLKGHGITLARRVTGGGAVYHDLQNLNYTIVGKSSDLERDYPRYTTYIAEALRSLGVNAEVSGRNDIMVEGKKVSGYAKRVWKDRLMVHGTLMWDVNLEELTQALSVDGSKLSSSGIASVRSKVTNLKDHLPDMASVTELKDRLEAIMSRDHKDSEYLLSESEKAAIEDLAKIRFSTWEWNYGHSLEASFSKKKKFACGTIEVLVAVNHGTISKLSFGGDFLGNRPAEDLAKMLEGCRYDKESVMAFLAEKPVEDYFDRLSDIELADLIV